MVGCTMERAMPSPTKTADAGQAISADFNAEGYRTRRFRAPIDRSPDPARQMPLSAALMVQPGRDALFIDVLPVESGVRDPETGIWRVASPHSTIPGSLWHPETGRAPPDPLLWRGLMDEIAKARMERPDLPVVLFCRTDCWMGWNAARRLAREGVEDVHWLAEGVEGWHAAGRALEPATPRTIAPDLTKR